MTPSQATEILQDVTYPGFTWLVGESGERIHLRAHFSAPCSKTGETISWLSRRWYLSCEATKSEVVQTALKIVLTAVEHEAREQFLYRGRAVFGPHMDVDALWSVADRDDARQDDAGKQQQRRLA